MEKFGLNVRVELTPESPQLAAMFITEKLLPLHRESWEAEKRQLYGREYDPNIPAIMQMWIGGFMKIVMLYSGDTVVGYLLALEVRPITHNIRLMQVEDYYVSPEYKGRGEKALFAFVQEMAIMTGCHELRIPEQGDAAQTFPLDQWEEKTPPTIIRSYAPKNA